MKMIWERFLPLAILCSFLISCSSGLFPTPTKDINIDQEASSTPTIKPPTSTLASTSEPTAASTPTSPPSSTPTITFTPSPTPIKFDGAVINEANFVDLEKFITLGKGSIEFASVSEDGRFHIIKTVRGIYLYETDTLDELEFFEGFSSFYLIPGKSAMVAVTSDLTLAVVNLDDQSLTMELAPADALSIETIAFSKDASYMAVTVSQPHHTRQNWTSYRIDVWNLVHGELISELESDLAGSCYQLSFSFDNSQLVTACSLSGGGYPRLFHWDTQTGTLNWSVANESVTDFPFSKDGSLVATSLNAPKYIIIRSSSSGTEVGRVSRGTVADNPFSPDNNHLLTISASGILVWRVSNSQLVKTIATDFPGLPAFSDDGEYVLISGGMRAYRASDFSLDESYPAPEDESYLESQRLPEGIPHENLEKKGHLNGVLGVELFEDDRLFVWGVRNHQNPWMNQSLWWWYPHQDIYEEISLGQNAGRPAWSPSKDQIAICTQEGLKLITIEDRNIEYFELCRSSSSPVVFSGDGKRLFLGSGIVINEFEIESRSILSQLRGHNYNIGDIISSEDGKYLFSTSADEISGGRESIIWTLDPNTFTHKWFVTAGSRSDLAFAQFVPDNADFVTIFGNEISVWRVSDGWYLANFEGNAMTILPEGKLAVVGLSNGNFDFYDTSNWKKIGHLSDEIEELPTEMMEIFFNPFLSPTGVTYLSSIKEGRVLISVNSENIINFWQIP